MSLLAEGIWNCTVLSATSGALKGVPFVQIKVRIEDGPSAGRLVTYERDIDTRSAKYAAMSMRSVGWNARAGNIESIGADCSHWIAKSGGKSTVEIKHIPYNDKKTGEPKIWDKANAIGRPLTNERKLDKLDGTALAEANEALARAMADSGGAPPDDAPPPTDDDLPFVSTHEPRGVARVIGGVL